MKERHALLTRLSRLAGPNGSAGGFTSTGEAWFVTAKTYPSGAPPREPSPRDIVRIWVEGDVLYCEQRDGTVQRRDGDNGTWEPS